MAVLTLPRKSEVKRKIMEFTASERLGKCREQGSHSAESEPDHSCSSLSSLTPSSQFLVFMIPYLSPQLSTEYPSRGCVAEFILSEEGIDHG